MSKIPVGLCQCGCGGKTNIARGNENGYKKGEPYRFIHYHWGHTEEEAIEKFWDRVDVRSKKECWLWQGSLDGKGRYGVTHFRRKQDGAHRVAYILTYGEIPAGLDVMHVVCDTPACCNPYHLRAGTRKENMDDMIEKDRDGWTCGVDRPGAKLNDDMVREIRKLYKTKAMTQKEMAKKFNISDTAIWSVIHHITWCHVLDED